MILVSALIGMCVLASSSDFITLFIGLELMALSFYVMVGFLRGDRRVPYGDVVRVLDQPDYRNFLVQNAVIPIGSPPEELGRYIQSEIVKWAKVIKDAGVRVD